MSKVWPILGSRADKEQYRMRVWNYLNIYRTNLHRIYGDGRVMAVDERSKAI